MLQYYAFTVNHKTVNLSKLHNYLVFDEPSDLLQNIKKQLNISELLYLNTCNRVLFLFVCAENVNDKFVKNFFTAINPKFDLENQLQSVTIYKGDLAIHHLFSIASSLDSLVIGEREILHQLRTAHTFCSMHQLSGDLIRIAIDHAVMAAKAVFTETKIGEKPVSVVSLAVQQLKKVIVSHDAKFLIIGAGQNNLLLTKILLQQGFKHFTIFNRTLENANRLAHKLNSPAYTLDELNNSVFHFDVLVTCTASQEPIINDLLYKKMLNGSKDKKIILDLSIPYNIDPEVIVNNNVHHIEIEILRVLAEKNYNARKSEIHLAEAVIEKYFNKFKEVLMQRIATKNLNKLPSQVRIIKKHAIQKVFHKKIETLDHESRAVLNEVLDYVEQKYIKAHYINIKESLRK